MSSTSIWSSPSSSIGEKLGGPARESPPSLRVPEAGGGCVGAGSAGSSGLMVVTPG